ncbi:nuclear transport factor 2 family protein [Mesorhizobium sp. M0491]|uniref:nuclear transport factor 2 family protein n=1 Tax=Mesorhizobium sp. M0491 TaxID=2956950 RepID=UPI003335CCD9
MLYSYIVEKSIRQSFDDVNNHRWDAAVKAIAPHVHHRVGGAHALGGERHDKQALRRWFERLGRVLPALHLNGQPRLGEGLAVACHRVCPVGWHRNPAQR